MSSQKLVPSCGSDQPMASKQKKSHAKHKRQSLSINPSAQPISSPDSESPDADGQLVTFLNTYDELGQYIAALTRFGISNLYELARMEELQLQKLAMKIRIKKKHRLKFHRAVDDLKSGTYAPPSRSRSHTPRTPMRSPRPDNAMFDFDLDKDDPYAQHLHKDKKQLIDQIVKLKNMLSADDDDSDSDSNETHMPYDKPALSLSVVSEDIYLEREMEMNQRQEELELKEQDFQV